MPPPFPVQNLGLEERLRAAEAEAGTDETPTAAGPRVSGGGGRVAARRAMFTMEAEIPPARAPKPGKGRRRGKSILAAKSMFEGGSEVCGRRALTV